MLYPLDRLKKFRIFIENLRFDVTPDLIFKPRFVTQENREELINETQGFSFYIDYLGGSHKPALMIMKTYNLTSKTIGQVEDVPEDLLRGAVTREGVRDYSGMFPIDEDVERWLKKELGLT
jgi:hypothetical protein